MTDIRSVSELQQKMSEEFAWRKKELHTIKSHVVASELRHDLNTAIRSGVTLLYAHWEGFIKEIGSLYLAFVEHERLSNNQLPRHFLALSVSRIVKQAGESKKIQPCLDLIDFFESQLTARNRINWRGVINTKSNLKSDIFKEISTVLGLDYSRFALKEKLIDEKLVGNRNHIAHGNYLLVDFEEYLGLHREVLGMMQDFYNQIENIAITGSHKIHPQPSNGAFSVAMPGE